MRRISALLLVLALTLIAFTESGCSSCRQRKESSPALQSVQLISPHLPFGNPGNAGKDPDNRLVLRQQFAASWNASRQTANWVAWRLTATDIGETERSQFYADPEIETPTPRDYTSSGFDRGHLCPSKDRSDTPENNRAVFTMLNIIPQAADNNRGPWVKLEEFARSLALAGREVYVIAGGSGAAGSFKGITVPDSTWKIIVALERGKSFPEGQEKAQVFAALLPNRDGIKDDRWQQYQTSVAEIERRTGYHFFTSSPVIDQIARTAR
ncbi:MAG TPA: DNA/RNA non-specific endonuclease [Blastocatellia bacterium]|nr:DNA/RNA non-specific endonuclease [Blastocatellia bacterium]